MDFLIVLGLELCLLVLLMLGQWKKIQSDKVKERDL